MQIGCTDKSKYLCGMIRTMIDIFSMQGIQRLWGYLGCTLLAAITPTGNFVVAVIIACFINLWCGMRADGVTNIRCTNFSWKKFKYALAEMMCFFLVLETMAVVCYLMGDKEMGFYACKVAAYCIVYCYVDNSLKNLCKAYPRSRGLWYVYLFVHLDFKRIIKIDELMERYDSHIQRMEEQKNGHK